MAANITAEITAELEQRILHEGDNEDAAIAEVAAEYHAELEARPELAPNATSSDEIVRMMWRKHQTIA